MKKGIFFDKYFKYYIAIVTIIITLCYGSLFLQGKMYIYLDIGADTYCGYWPIYTFFSNAMKNIPLSFWSFNIGLGGNVHNFSYDLFDPFNLVLFLFPSSIIEIGILITAIIKIYFVGIFSYLYLKQIGFFGFSTIIGSLSFTFCGYFIGFGQHYSFASMFALFTLLMYSFERWVNTSKWFLFSLSVALLASNSLYFTYMISVYLSFYCVFRYLVRNQFVFGEFIKYISKIVLISFIGLGLSAMISLPQAYYLLQSPRVGAKIFPEILKASNLEYKTILYRIISNNILGINEFKGFRNYYESPFLYTSLLTMFAVPIVLFNNYRKKIYICITTLILFALLVPSFSNYVFNGFSAYTYRWTFCLVPVLSVVIAKAICIIEKNSFNKKILLLPVIFLGSLLLKFWTTPALMQTTYTPDKLGIIVSLIVAAAVIICYTAVLFLKEKLLNRSSTFCGSLLLILIIELSVNTYVTINIRGNIETKEKFNIPYFDATSKALKYIEKLDESFYRINKTYAIIDLNDPMMQQYRGEKLYSSIISKELSNYRNLFELRVKDSNYFYGFDDCADLRNFNSVKYMLTKQANKYAGYKYLDVVDNVYVYENLQTLPFGYAYDKYISYEDFIKLNKYDKQTIMYDAYVVNSKNESLATESIKNISEYDKIDEQSYSFSSEMMSLENADIIENNFPTEVKFISRNKDPNLSIQLSNPTISSVHLSFTLNSSNKGNGKIYLQVSDREFNEEDALPFAFVSGKKEYHFTINTLDVKKIKIFILNNLGKELTIQDISINKRSDSAIENKINRLRQNAFNVEYFSDGDIKGSIDIVMPKMLFLSLPYDRGWQATIDGVPTTIHNINIAFSGIDIPAGFHTIELHYRTPYLLVGVIMTAGTILGIVLFILIRRYHCRRERI